MDSRIRPKAVCMSERVTIRIYPTQSGLAVHLTRKLCRHRGKPPIRQLENPLCSACNHQHSKSTIYNSLVTAADDILTLAPPPADSRVAYGSDPNQFADLRLPKTKGPHPTIIDIHGGFWRAKYNLDHTGHLCAALTSKGIATANLEYRRVGNEGGAWPNTFADIRSAYNFLLQNARQHHLDPHKFLVMGHSAGGQLALCLAAHEPGVTRIVSLAGVVDLRRC